MSHKTYQASYCTRCSGEDLRKKVDEVKSGFCYKAQDLVDVLEYEKLWEDAIDDDNFTLKDDNYPSPVSYKNKTYDFYDVWDDMDYNPYAFILVEQSE